MDVTSDKKTTANDYRRKAVKKDDYSDYVRKLVVNAIQKEPGYVKNLSTENLLLRSFMVAVFLCGIFLCLCVFKLSLFSQNTVANIISYTVLFTFVLTMMIMGISFSVVPFFVLGLSVFISAMTAKYICYVTDFWNLAQMTLLIFLAIFALVIFTYTKIIKQDIFDDRIDYYEKAHVYTAVNMELKSYAPITCFPILFIFKINVSQSLPIEYALFVRNLVSVARKHRCVLAGYTGNVEEKDFTVYVYGTYNSVRNNAFTSRLSAMSKTYRIIVSDISASTDINWDCYLEKLYPDQRQLCDIVSRKNMEELFSLGIDFDCEYDVSFSVKAMDRQSIDKIGESLSHYGFSYGEDSVYIEDDFYICDYTIYSYVTTRRIDFLNELIYTVCCKNDGVYCGEWTI